MGDHKVYKCMCCGEFFFSIWQFSQFSHKIHFISTDFHRKVVCGLPLLSYSTSFTQNYRTNITFLHFYQHDPMRSNNSIFSFNPRYFLFLRIFCFNCRAEILFLDLDCLINSRDWSKVNFRWSLKSLNVHFVLLRRGSDKLRRSYVHTRARGLGRRRGSASATMLLRGPITEILQRVVT